MFTLSSIILEDGEIYFGIFGVRLVFFYFVFLRVEIIQKKGTDLRAVSGGDSSPGPSL